MPEFNDLKITSLTRQTSESVAMSFDLPEALRAEYRFQPGQYLTLRAEVDGQDIRRSYSISMGDAPLTFDTKQVDGGAFSAFAQRLKPGDSLSVMAPQGRFTPNDDASLLLVAAGSGITPMMSIAADALERKARVRLVYGNRQTSSIMFRAELGALKDRCRGQFTLIHILSREEQDVPLFNGRITGEKIAALAKAGAIDPGCDGTFLCGPDEMIDDVAETLSGLDMPPHAFISNGSIPKRTRPVPRAQRPPKPPPHQVSATYWMAHDVTSPSWPGTTPYWMPHTVTV